MPPRLNSVVYLIGVLATVDLHCLDELGVSRGEAQSVQLRVGGVWHGFARRFPGVRVPSLIGTVAHVFLSPLRRA